MKKKYIKWIIAAVCLLLLARACYIRTPEIHGTVIDAETKQPVEGAWVTSSLWLKSITVAGDVTSYPRLDRPHTRTGKDGRFVIPARTFMRILIPFKFYTRVEKSGISANTADGSGGGVSLEGKLWGWRTEVTAPIESAKKDDERKMAQYLKDGITRERAEELIARDYFAEMQSLYSYCLTGRQSVEVPAVQEGCDDWELDFVIKRHEWYLKRFSLNRENRADFSIVFENIGVLSERQGDTQKALEYYKKAREIRYFRPQDLDGKISSLQKKK